MRVSPAFMVALLVAGLGFAGMAQEWTPFSRSLGLLIFGATLVILEGFNQACHLLKEIRDRERDR